MKKQIAVLLISLCFPLSAHAASELERVLTVLRLDIGIANVTPDMNLMAGGFDVTNLPPPFTRYYNSRYGRNLSHRFIEGGFGYCTTTEGENAGRNPWRLPSNSYLVTARCLAKWIARNGTF